MRKTFILLKLHAFRQTIVFTTCRTSVNDSVSIDD